MRIVPGRHVRSLRIEALEYRAMMSATPLAAGVPSAAFGAAALQSAAAAPGDIVVPIHAQLGGSALETVLGIAANIDTLQQALNGYLNEVPGWHLTGGFDKTPNYSGSVDGSLVLAATGMVKSANVTLNGSADIAAAIEGYYGVSVLHVGVGVAADLSANLSATASYSVDTNAWYFGGSASLVGSVKGYASAMAWPVKGEIYIAGALNASAAVSSSTGLASANVAVVGSIGADAQLKSLFGGWTTIASVSRNLGSWHYGATFDVGAWMRSEVGSVAAANQPAAVVAALAANAKATASDVSPSTLSAVAANQATVAGSLRAVPVVASPTAAQPMLSSGNGLAAATTVAARADAIPQELLAPVHAAVLQQLDVASLLTSGDLAA